MNRTILVLAAMLALAAGVLRAQTPAIDSVFTAPIPTGHLLSFKIIDSQTVAVSQSFDANYYAADCLFGRIDIPEYITFRGNTYTVAAIADTAFVNCRLIDSISIPATVTSIGRMAFENCTSLRTVQIPNTVSTIGIGTFLDCKGLTSATLPNTLTEIPGRMFDGCIKLSDITIPPSVTTIGMSAFNGARLTPTFTIPPSVDTIDAWAFIGSGVRDVTLPPSVQMVSIQAFAFCPGLVVKVENPNMGASYDAFEQALLLQWEGATRHYGAQCLNSYIEDSLLYTDSTKTTLCGALPDIHSAVIPSTVTTIGSRAFAYCYYLTSVVIPPSVDTIGSLAFLSSEVDTITVPSTVSSIADYAFNGLLNVNYHGSLDGAPWGAAYLNRVVKDSMCFSQNGDTLLGAFCNIAVATIPDSVTTIAPSAFSGCYHIASITIPPSVATIGSYAYQNCNRLASITVPSTVTAIGDEVFRGCTRLANADIQASVATIGTGLFYGCTNLRSVSLPPTLTKIPPSTFARCKSLTSITIPETVNEIGVYAFSDCSSLDSVVLPPAVTTLGGSDFDHCTSLRSINLPEGLTAIPPFAFDSCINLRSIVIPPTVTEIQEGAFYNCRSLSSVVIPSSVSRIRWLAFQFTPLAPLEVPSTVSTIEPGAFFAVPNVIYHGQAEGAPWNALCLNGYTEDSLIYTSEAKDTLAAAHPDLVHAVIPHSVKVIGHHAFFACRRLASITSQNPNPPELHPISFRCEHYGAEVTVPCHTDYRNAMYWNCFDRINESLDFPYHVHTMADSTQGRVDTLKVPDCADNTSILQAVPNQFYNFVRWSDGPTDNPRRITVETDTTVAALFEPKKETQIVVQPDRHITVFGAEGQHIRIIDLLGRTVAEVPEAPLLCSLRMQGGGVYLVQVGDDEPHRIIVH